MFPDAFREKRQGFAALVEFSGKFLILDRLLHYLRSQTKDRIVVVSNFTSSLDLIQNMCRDRQYPVLRLDGSINPNKRTKLVTPPAPMLE